MDHMSFLMLTPSWVVTWEVAIMKINIDDARLF